ncbi:Tegument antigen [Clonorchis sinensis]|uniref:Tegument antigen n=2 Tax=Clonorchis sinensis TaxID=79923 RepID=H2KQG7_CLOSI|nr:Tegument antigen [Clonorchis sinensis]GAA36916.1 tegument antigen [Clonorchis sinensis]
MEPFMDAYLSIDRRQRGWITEKDLENYVQRNKLDPSMITRWSELFDAEGTGRITLEKFCEVLGLKLADIQKRREEHGPATLHPDIKVIWENMALTDQIILGEETIQEFKSISTEEDLTRLSESLKSFADRQLGGVWQVVIVDGSYWTTQTFLPNMAFQFELYGRAYLFWQTAEDEPNIIKT